MSLAALCRIPRFNQFSLESFGSLSPLRRDFPILLLPHTIHTFFKGFPPYVARRERL